MSEEIYFDSEITAARNIGHAIPWSESPRAAEVFSSYFIRNIKAMNFSNYKIKKEIIKGDIKRASDRDYISISLESSLMADLKNKASECVIEEEYARRITERGERVRLLRFSKSFTH